MPVPPGAWLQDGMISAQQLNTDLYSFDGTGMAANGILFHTHRPAVLEVMGAGAATVAGAAVNSQPRGVWSNLGSFKGLGTAYAVLDTSALFGLGSDNPAQYATFESGYVASTLNGTAGAKKTSGGWVLAWVFPSLGHPSAPTSPGTGCGFYQKGSPVSYGVIQTGSTSRDDCPFCLDLLNTGGAVFSPAVFCGSSNAAGFSVAANGTGTCGEMPRMGGFWVSVSQDGAALTVTSPPSIPVTYTPATQITQASFGSNISAICNFLNYPPCLRVSQQLTTTVTAGTYTTVPFTATPSVDSYAGFSTTSSTYTVPVSGVYLVHANVIFSGNSTSGNRAAYLLVNGTRVFGGNYLANSQQYMGTGTPITRILDLRAGDTIQVGVYSTASTTLGTYPSRLVVCWLSALGSGLGYTVPDTTWRWTAGTPGSQLPALFTRYIGNDLNFLVSKPYALAYQATAQPLTLGSWTAVRMDTVAGMIHGSPGDNYGGWSTSLSATIGGTKVPGLAGYQAKVPGWYLVFHETSVTVSPSSPAEVVAGIICPTSGGIPQPTDSTGTQVDWYQHVQCGGLSGGPPAATAIGLYYLAAGEYVIPAVMPQDNPSSPSTSISSYNSSFGCVWVTA